MALPLAILAASVAFVLVGTALAASATVVDTGVSAVTGNSAVLEATINPEGEATTYHFEYGTADCSTTPCASFPVPDGNVGSGTSPVHVAKELTGLLPGTTYHFRVVATNGSGPTAGPDRRFTTSVSDPAQSCPNAQFRTGPSAFLPDCRAYEMVSPVEKNGANIGQSANGKSGWVTTVSQSSVDGEKITYTGLAAFGDQVGSLYANQYIASRGSVGWSTHGINPAHVGRIYPEYLNYWDLDNEFRAFTPDLSSAWLFDTAEPPLTPDGRVGEVNFYRRDNLNNTYEALTPPFTFKDAPTTSHSMELYGLSKDGSKAVMSWKPEGPSSNNELFLFSGGSWHLVSILPDGTPAPQATIASAGLGSPPESRLASVSRAVSDDGSRIIWHSSPEDLYVRENPDQPQSALDGGGKCTEPEKACTIVVDEAPGVVYQTASTDGSKILYMDDPRPNPLEGASLYEFNVNTGSQQLIARESHGVVGGNDDLSRFYFDSLEALAPGAMAGSPNLYLSDAGTIRFIATLAMPDVASNQAVQTLFNIPVFKTGRVSADGSTVAFDSASTELSELVAGFDNRDAVNGKPLAEVYAYDADADSGQGKLVCVSCNPTGVRPHGQLRPKEVFHEVTRETGTIFELTWAAAWLKTPENMLYMPRVISTDGSRVFFNSRDGLVPRDSNEQIDVYQWETQGSGSCQRPEGCVSLISSGESVQPSKFVDASPDGRDVFFTTASSLVPQDPNLADLYDARVGGGFPSPPVPPAACEGEACQGLPAAPNDPTPASASYSGPGNVPPQARKKAHGKKHKKHHGKHRKRRGGKGKPHARTTTHRNG